MTVAGIFHQDGIISANGANGELDSGGGSGGSILLNICETIAMQANSVQSTFSFTSLTLED